MEKKKSKSKRRSSSSSSSDSSSDEEDFAEECLKAHNEYRKKHGVPSLKLNKKVSALSVCLSDDVQMMLLLCVLS